MSLNINETKTRIMQDPMNSDKWQAQYYEASMKLWFDIGEGKDSREEAEASLQEAKEADSVQAAIEAQRLEDSKAEPIAPAEPVELSVQQLALLRSYKDGPFIWDATSVFEKVIELSQLGLVRQADPNGNSYSYELTDTGRAIVERLPA